MKIRVQNGKNVLCSHEIGGENSCLLLSFLLVLFLTTILHIPLLVSAGIVMPLTLFVVAKTETDAKRNLQKIKDDPVICSIRMTIESEVTVENPCFRVHFKHCGITEPLEMRVDSDAAKFLSFNKKMAAAERELTLTYCRTIPLLYYLTPVETL